MNDKINKIIEQLKSMGYDDSKISKYFDAQYDILKQSAQQQRKRDDAQYDLNKFDMQQEAKRLQAEDDIRRFDMQQEAKAAVNQEFIEKHTTRR